jgi:hypothetical protein
MMDGIRSSVAKPADAWFRFLRTNGTESRLNRMRRALERQIVLQ